MAKLSSVCGFHVTQLMKEREEGCKVTRQCQQALTVHALMLLYPALER